MKIRDRIKELRRVKASELRPNPRNWRLHPPAQQGALRGVLAEIGYAGALLARETSDGTLMLIDGHLRAETTPETDVPVLVLDVDEAEADKILLTYDPLAGMAGVDTQKHQLLAAELTTECAALQAMIESSLAQLAIDAPNVDLPPPPAKPGVKLGSSFQVVVECRDEEDQETVYERMRAEGYRCRVLTL